MTRYRISARFYFFSVLVHAALLVLMLMVRVAVIKPPPPEPIKVNLRKGAQLVESSVADGKMEVLIKELAEYDEKLAAAESARKALEEALGAYSEELIEDFSDDFEIGGDSDAGFDSGLSFQKGQELVELGKEAVPALLDALENLEDDFKTRRRAAK
ncbi:MAG: hypothetical protein QGD94_10205, partial [Planctomycetia bacterium]|nr:hypothetical protein [Planctomycetia bacterium]